MSAGALLSMGLLPGRLGAEENGRGGEFTFVALNDAHYQSPACPAWFERVTRSIRALDPKPEFCLMIGDLAEHGTEAELGPMRDVLQGLGLEWHTVIGNHDHANDTDRSVYERLFPGRLNYAFEHRDWQFVGLDTCQGTQWQETRIQRQTLAWLDEHLPRLDRARPTVIFTHFPLGMDVPMRSTNADDLLERFRDFNLVSVLNGHYHGVTERIRGGVEISTSRCCAISCGNHDGSGEKGYVVCAAKEGSVRRRFVEVTPDRAATLHP